MVKDSTWKVDGYDIFTVGGESGGSETGWEWQAQRMGMGLATLYASEEFVGRISPSM